ncbi:hypothetical protein Q8A73_004057 [Channa argus]|nr:hypothetical protein Q8A73_004057 [Channa argus]
MKEVIWRNACVGAVSRDTSSTEDWFDGVCPLSTGGGRMLWLLLCLLPPLGGGRVVTQDVTYEERHEHEAAPELLNTHRKQNIRMKSAGSDWVALRRMVQQTDLRRRLHAVLGLCITQFMFLISSYFLFDLSSRHLLRVDFVLLHRVPTCPLQRAALSSLLQTQPLFVRLLAAFSDGLLLAAAAATCGGHAPPRPGSRIQQEAVSAQLICRRHTRLLVTDV